MRTVNMVNSFPEPERFTLNCPTQQTLDVIGNKWTVIILYCLAYGPKRHGEIYQRIEGISQKVLTQVLRRLERHGLVNRRVISEMPANVEYSLTELGKTLLEPLQAIARWSQTNFAAVMQAQAHYDCVQRRK